MGYSGTSHRGVVSQVPAFSGKIQNARVNPLSGGKDSPWEPLSDEFQMVCNQHTEISYFAFPCEPLETARLGLSLVWALSGG